MILPFQLCCLEPSLLSWTDSTLRTTPLYAFSSPPEISQSSGTSNISMFPLQLGLFTVTISHRGLSDFLPFKGLYAGTTLLSIPWPQQLFESMKEKSTSPSLSHLRASKSCTMWTTPQTLAASLGWTLSLLNRICSSFCLKLLSGGGNCLRLFLTSWEVRWVGFFPRKSSL